MMVGGWKRERNGVWTGRKVGGREGGMGYVDGQEGGWAEGEREGCVNGQEGGREGRYAWMGRMLGGRKVRGRVYVDWQEGGREEGGKERSV